MRYLVRCFYIATMLIFLFGCSTKVKVYELSDGAFVENFGTISIHSNDTKFPLFNQAVINELTDQIRKDGFLINNENYNYRIDIATVNLDQIVSRSYIPIYNYYRYCDRYKNCYYDPVISYVPCIDLSSFTTLNVGASNIDKNINIDFFVDNSEFVSNCHRFDGGLGRYYNYGFYTYFDHFLVDNLNKENIFTIAKKIKNSIFPLKTTKKETLFKEIKSLNVSKNIADLFSLGYENAKEKNYEKAINLYEEIKNLTNLVPDELLFNLGVLYENLSKFDEALENYSLLSENFVGRDTYISRILVKKRYENR